MKGNNIKCQCSLFLVCICQKKRLFYFILYNYWLLLFSSNNNHLICRKLWLFYFYLMVCTVAPPAGPWEQYRNFPKNSQAESKVLIYPGCRKGKPYDNVIFFISICLCVCVPVCYQNIS